MGRRQCQRLEFLLYCGRTPGGKLEPLQENADWEGLGCRRGYRAGGVSLSDLACPLHTVVCVNRCGYRLGEGIYTVCLHIRVYLTNAAFPVAVCVYWEVQYMIYNTSPTTTTLISTCVHAPPGQVKNTQEALK